MTKDLFVLYQFLFILVSLSLCISVRTFCYKYTNTNMLLNPPENVNNTGFTKEECPLIMKFILFLRTWSYLFELRHFFGPKIQLFVYYILLRQEWDTELCCLYWSVLHIYTIYNPFPLLVDRSDVKRENLRVNDARRRPISSQSGPTDVKTQTVL